MSVGDMNWRVRRPSTPGANQQIIFNKGGVDGASPNLTFDYNANVLNVTSLNVAANIANVGNLLVTQNIATGNLVIAQNVVAGNINVANINVSANVSNAGNILVTQNIYTGNIIVTQNTATGNLSVTQNISAGNINVANINVSANISNAGNILVSQNVVTGNITINQNTSTGNLSITQNTTAGNISAANVNVSATLNVAANISNTGNLLVTQNTFTGNLGITQNVSAGNISAANITISAIANLATANIPTLKSPNTATYANGTVVLSTANVNFNNTATVNVVAAANGTNQSNISFVANISQILEGVVSGNTSNINVTYNANGDVVIDTRLPPGSGGGAYEVDVYANGTSVLTNANLNFINTSFITVYASANGSTQANVAFNVDIATTSQQGVTQLIDSITSTDIGNAATANAVAWVNSIAQTALSLGAAAYTYAGQAANLVAVYANGTIVLANANINFNNTATINVSATANGSGQANIAFSVNTAAVNGGSGSYEVDVYANGSSVLANANLNFNNTSLINVFITANGTTQANVAMNSNILQTAINTAPLVGSGYIAYYAVL